MGQGEPCLGKVVVGGALQGISPTFCLQEDSGESQRGKLFGSKLATGNRLEGSHERVKLSGGWKGMELCLEPWD